MSEEEDIDETQIYSKNNRVYFYADVNRETVIQLRKCIDKCKEYICLYNINSEFDKLDNIYLYIFSDGGEVYSAFSIIDYILKSNINIVTICEGCVSSSGVLISLAGSERYIRRNAFMLIHEIRSGFSGKFSEIQDDMDNNNIIMEKCKQYILDRCNNKLLNNKIDKFLKHDKIWSSKKCLKYGLVTKIV